MYTSFPGMGTFLSFIILICLSVYRSPGGTPAKKNKRGSGSPSSFSGYGTPTEPLYRALVNSMQKKFRNVRSPSPAGGLYNNAMSPASASVSPGFTP